MEPGAHATFDGWLQDAEESINFNKDQYAETAAFKLHENMVQNFPKFLEDSLLVALVVASLKCECNYFDCSQMFATKYYDLDFLGFELVSFFEHWCMVLWTMEQQKTFLMQLLFVRCRPEHLSLGIYVYIANDNTDRKYCDDALSLIMQMLQDNNDLEHIVACVANKELKCILSSAELVRAVFLLKFLYSQANVAFRKNFGRQMFPDLSSTDTWDYELYHRTLDFVDKHSTTEQLNAVCSCELNEHACTLWRDLQNEGQAKQHGFYTGVAFSKVILPLHETRLLCDIVLFARTTETKWRDGQTCAPDGTIVMPNGSKGRLDKFGDGTVTACDGASSTIVFRRFARHSIHHSEDCRSVTKFLRMRVADAGSKAALESVHTSQRFPGDVFGTLYLVKGVADDTVYHHQRQDNTGCVSHRLESETSRDVSYFSKCKDGGYCVYTCGDRKVQLGFTQLNALSGAVVSVHKQADESHGIVWMHPDYIEAHGGELVHRCSITCQVTARPCKAFVRAQGSKTGDVLEPHVYELDTLRKIFEGQGVSPFTKRELTGAYVFVDTQELYSKLTQELLERPVVQSFYAAHRVPCRGVHKMGRRRRLRLSPRAT